MANRVVLNDGTTYSGASASMAGNGHQLLVSVPGDGMVQLALAFSDPEKISKIVCFNGVYKYTYTGFTELYSIQHFDEDNSVELWLRGGNATKTRELIVPKEYVPEMPE